MKVVVSGGTGMIGRALSAHLLSLGRDVYVLTRQSERARRIVPEGVKTLEWDGRTDGPWSDVVATANVVVNLAGESIGGGRWTKARKELIVNSRIDATRAIVRAMAKRPDSSSSLLVSASGKDIYGDVDDAIVAEDAPQGTGFLADTCGKWEKEAQAAELDGATVTLIRLGLVLGRGGALDQMMLPFKLFVGGPIGSGRQWISWIHLDDVVRLIADIIDRYENDGGHVDIAGPFNATSPQPVTMKAFSKTLGHVMKRPSWFPVPTPVIKAVLGEMSDLLLVSQKAMPQRAANIGFDFEYPDLESALKHIIQRR